MDKSLIILALETLREQVLDGTEWSCGISGDEGQSRIYKIDKQIELIRTNNE